MKIRGDFQTNSSSASFILKIKSKWVTFDDFERSWKDFKDHYIDYHSWDINEKVKKTKEYIETLKKEHITSKKPKDGIKKFFREQEEKLCKQTDDEIIDTIIGFMFLSNGPFTNLFEVTNHVTMYNDYSDIPDIFRYAILKNNIDPGFLEREFGMEELRIVIEEDN